MFGHLGVWIQVSAYLASLRHFVPQKLEKACESRKQFRWYGGCLTRCEREYKIMERPKGMKQSSKKSQPENEFDAMGKTHARRLCFCLDACRYMELHPDQIPQDCETVGQMRARNSQMIAAWESLTEEHFAVIAIATMEEKAARLKLDVYWEHNHGDPEKARRYEARLLKVLGCSARAGLLAMPEPGAVSDLTVRAISQTGLHWILFEWKPAREGGLVFGYRLQRRTSPNAVWQTLGTTNEVEFCVVNAVPYIEHEYRVVAFNLTGDTAGE